MPDLARLLTVFLHLDVFLGQVIQRFGAWSYVLLFLVIFMETGIVVTPFLPGDSLLFAAGTFAAVGSLNIFWLYVVLAGAAIIGDTVNYWIGRRLDGKLFTIKPEHLEKTRRFYEKYGGKTIIFSRFVPIVRTVAPFVAGVGRMNYPRFLSYNVAGGILWSGLFLMLGYFFGNIPTVKNNFTIAILVIIVISILPGIVEAVKQKKAAERST